MALVTAAVQRLRDLDTDIRQQGAVDPALAWIAYRVREVEELLGAVGREPVKHWVSPDTKQAGVRRRTFEEPALSETRSRRHPLPVDVRILDA